MAAAWHRMPQKGAPEDAKPKQEGPTRYATLADWGFWAAQIASGHIESNNSATEFPNLLLWL